MPQETRTTSSGLTCWYRLCGKHDVCCSLVVAAASENLHRSSTLPSLTYAVAHARSEYGDDEAGEGDAAQQDHMSAYDLTNSATASEF